jgi:hypothetical protein
MGRLMQCERSLDQIHELSSTIRSGESICADSVRVLVLVLREGAAYMHLQRTCCASQYCPCIERFLIQRNVVFRGMYPLDTVSFNRGLPLPALPRPLQKGCFHM